METLHFNQTTKSFKADDLAARLESVLNNASSFIKENDYRITGDPALFNKIDLNAINLLSLNKRKNLSKRLHYCEQVLSLSKVNRLYHFLASRILDTKERVKVKVSEKEEKIDQARTAYKKAKAEADKLRLVYKTEKGDFYKVK